MRTKRIDTKSYALIAIMAAIQALVHIYEENITQFVLS